MKFRGLVSMVSDTFMDSFYYISFISKVACLITGISQEAKHSKKTKNQHHQRGCKKRKMQQLWCNPYFIFSLLFPDCFKMPCTWKLQHWSQKEINFTFVVRHKRRRKWLFQHKLQTHRGWTEEGMSNTNRNPRSPTHTVWLTGRTDMLFIYLFFLYLVSMYSRSCAIVNGMIG